MHALGALRRLCRLKRKTVRIAHIISYFKYILALIRVCKYANIIFFFQPQNLILKLPRCKHISNLSYLVLVNLDDPVTRQQSADEFTNKSAKSIK